MRAPSNRRLLLSPTALLLVAGCGLSPRQDPTVFLVLAPGVAEVAIPMIARPDLHIGVGPVTLPRYLDRPQLVTRLDATELAVHEFARWSAPLGALVADAIGENLMGYLAAGGVRTYPWPASERPNVSVRLWIQQFEPVAPDSAVLRARWQIVDAAGQPIGEPQASQHRTMAPAGPKAEALALSRLIGLLAADIAGVMRSVDVAP